MSRFSRHILIPMVATLAIVGLYLTPVSLIGCANRGIAALVVALASLTAGLAAAALAVRARGKRDGSSAWWIASACLLSVPALLVLGPLG